MLVHRSAPAYQPAACGRSMPAASSLRVMKAVPRGASNHLYPPHTVRSKAPASTGSQPTAWVRSTSVRVPCAAAAARIASRSARAPSADWTAETATRVVSSPMASASRCSGASRTRTPRPAWARNGKLTDVNSPSAHKTSLPEGSEAATSPTRGLTWLPTATAEGATPTSAA